MNIRNFFKGNPRSVKAKKNIVASAVLKGFDGIIYLLIVPVTLGYLNSYEYGIWITLNSIIMWINSFDIGLGNGMRNKLASAVAKDDYELGRRYVSTTFFMLVIVMGSLIVIGSICSQFINWYDILGTNSTILPHLTQIVYITFVLFCINFIFKFIGNVYLALQMPSINNLLVVSGNGLALLSVYVLTKTTQSSLLNVAIAFSISPLIVYLIAYPITFNIRYRNLAPSIKYFNVLYLKDLFGIGVQFFILQISGILMVTVTNLIISHMFGPENVTSYGIAYRYLSVVIMVYNLIMAPIWSATTDAYVKGEINWIKRANKKIHKILCLIMIILMIMVIISKYIYNFWIGQSVNIPLNLTCIVALYDIIVLWSLSYSSFLNGLGKLRIQTILSITIGVIIIPLSYIGGDLFGVIGVVGALCFIHIITLIFNKIQFTKVIENRATGIWNK